MAKTKTKIKKDKGASSVKKIARKTLGLVVRVGDALEAVAVAAASVPPAPVPVPAPVVSGPAAVIAANAVVDDAARAVAAIEAYAALHNLQAVDMPSRGTLVGALVVGMARHGSKFTDADVRSLLDEQMRSHFRTLGARTNATTAAGA